MNVRERHVAGIAVVALAAIVSVYAYGRVPEEMVTHWGPSGPDGSMDRTVALIGLPALAAGLLLVFEIVPRIDPLGQHIRNLGRYYDLMVVVVVGMIGYVHVLVVMWNLGYAFDMIQAIVPAVAAVFYVAGVIMDHVDRNWFLGVRTPWTLSSDEVWERTHAQAGPLFKIAAVLTLGAVVLPQYGIVFVLGPILAVSAYLTVYSYVAYSRLPDSPDEPRTNGNV